MDSYYSFLLDMCQICSLLPIWVKFALKKVQKQICFCIKSFDTILGPSVILGSIFYPFYWVLQPFTVNIQWKLTVYKLWRAHAISARAIFRTHSTLGRVHDRTVKGNSKVKWERNGYFVFFRATHLTRGSFQGSFYSWCHSYGCTALRKLMKRHFWL